MLQEFNGAITETVNTMAMTTGGAVGVGSTGCVDYGLYGAGATSTGVYTTYWNNYPVYICTDKTAKAIEIVKLMQAEKLIDIKSVPKFIDIVEKIVKTL